MSHLESVVRQQLKLNKEFTFLGDDGALVQANDLDGVLALHIVDRNGKTLFDHYSDLPCLLSHLKAHGGHLYS